jgi:hypothetical protein
MVLALFQILENLREAGLLRGEGKSRIASSGKGLKRDVIAEWRGLGKLTT